MGNVLPNRIAMWGEIPTFLSRMWLVTPGTVRISCQHVENGFMERLQDLGS